MRSTLIGPLTEMALDAGAAIMDVYAGMRPEDVKIKSDGSPVTRADALAEGIILARLHARWPDIPVVAEEAVAAGNVPDTGGGRFFLVDPLDGTKEFLRRNGDFTVNIALIEEGAAVLGVVYAPATGEIYTGGFGEPARRATVVQGKAGDWQRIRVHEADAAAPLRIIASRSHLNGDTQAFIARFPDAEFITTGSSLKFCRLASGAADLYPRLSRTMEWDIAAGDAVLQAAGGKVTDLEGVPIRYGKRNQAGDSDFANGSFIACGGFDWMARKTAAGRIAQ